MDRDGYDHEYQYSQRTWGHIVEHKAKTNGDRPYVYFKDETVSYAQLNERASRLANGYASLGVRKGDRVAAMLPNCPPYLYHFYALAKIGAVDNPVNTALKGDMLRHVINNSACKVFLIDEQYLERLKFIQDELPTLENVVVLSSDRGASGELGLGWPACSLERLLDYPAGFRSSAEVKPSDPLMIIYTSGTTGPAKGVVMPHHKYYLDCLDWHKLWGVTKEDVVYNCAPFFHLNHRGTSGYTMLLGGAYAMGVRFSASGFWDEIRRYRATAFQGLGAMGAFLLAQPPSKSDTDHSLRTVQIAPLTVEQCREFERRFGVTLHCSGYGLSECIFFVSMSLEDAERLKAQGRWRQAFSAGREQKQICEVKLVDDDDREVAVGEAGEAICRPARPYAMMSGYINDPQTTLKVFRNLWLHSGDMLRRDADGYYYFVDRKKDYMRRRGENISSFDVEKVVNAHPAVLESAAIGVKSAAGEDEVKIVVVLNEGQKLAPEELIAWCEPRMAYFMVPRYVEFRDKMPRTQTERIEKYRLREEGVTENTWDREEAGYKISRD